MVNYEVTTFFDGKQARHKVESDGTILLIPFDPANSDYQAYLRWLENPDAEEGGTL